MSAGGSLDDLRLFARVAEARSFTAAGRLLGVPKQTLSRRIAALERALGVELLHRTTRRLHLTEAGAAYAGRCAEIVRLAEEATRAVSDTRQIPRGVLRVTADPVFGEAFLTGLVVQYARRWPEVAVQVVLTRRRVDLVDEGFDVAFRVGQVDDPALTAVALGPARIRYCASPRYLARHGAPASPRDLARHQCLLVGGDDGSAVRWPFRGRAAAGVTLPPDRNGTAGLPRFARARLLPVSGRLQLSSFAMAHAAALAGLGIAIFPEFACAEDLRRRRLVAVLDDWVVPVGSVWLVHPAQRYLAARVKTFVELARARFARPPWLPGRRRRRAARGR